MMDQRLVDFIDGLPDHVPVGVTVRVPVINEHFRIVGYDEGMYSLIECRHFLTFSSMEVVLPLRTVRVNFILSEYGR